MGKSFSNGKMWNCANRSMGEWESGEMGREANEQMACDGIYLRDIFAYTCIHCIVFPFTSY